VGKNQMGNDSIFIFAGLVRRWFWTARCLFYLLLSILVVCPSCTNQRLQKYRNDAYLNQHRYVLGEKYICVNGIRMCYQDVGEGETILIIPGLGTSIDFWQLNIPELSKHYRVVAVDPPGFGKSDKPDVDYTLTWLTERIIDFLDAKKIDKVSIIGGSMGGHLGLILALNHPDRVSHLVMMGSTGNWERPGIFLDWGIQTFWRDEGMTDYFRVNWPRIYGKMFNQQTPVIFELFRYQMAVRADEQRYAPEGRAASRSLKSLLYSSCRDRLAEVSVPVLLIWGEDDHIHGVENGRYFYAHIPGSQLCVIPNAPHEVMIDQPERFNQLVLEFFASDGQPSTVPCEFSVR
jgi:pimeloyl-ACP methyl ester carboxylesterase